MEGLGGREYGKVWNQKKACSSQQKKDARDAGKKLE